MKIAIVGATGLVGKTILKVLKERSVSYSEILLIASEKSVGKTIVFNNENIKIIGLRTAIDLNPDIAIFSAGGSISKEWAPKFAENGTTVIDNSSVWRGYDHIPLVVPEINGNLLKSTDKIIANPNCSTIQVVMALAPLHAKFKIKRLVISTYQSVSGSGQSGIQQLQNERTNIEGQKCYPHQIDMNCIPQGGDFLENGYSEEEMKLVHETRKILNDKNIAITSTVVRVPVTGGHSAAVNVEFYEDFAISQVTQLLTDFEGVTVVDNPQKSEYPMPLDAQGKDDVFVGRIRKDISNSNSLDFWIVSDNLRKGAATNTVQILNVVKNLM